MKLVQNVQHVSCCSDLWYFDQQFWFELTELLKENPNIEAIWTITKPGCLIVGSCEWYHQVLPLTHTLATAIDWTPDDEEHWNRIAQQLKRQHNYLDFHQDENHCRSICE